MALRGKEALRVYVDTSAWIALKEARDSHHKRATEKMRKLIGSRAQLVTGLHTIVEFVDGVAQRHGQGDAARTYDWIAQSPSVRVLASDGHRDDAVALLRARTGWDVDLSDCLSFAMMTSEGIRHVFTYDRDFEKAGFERVG